MFLSIAVFHDITFLSVYQSNKIPSFNEMLDDDSNIFIHV